MKLFQRFVSQIIYKVAMESLQQRFKLSEKQAQAILAIKFKTSNRFRERQN
ncbi:hypothetical protein ACVPOW_12105 [Staphylococcus aureus]